jgi:hypothetical protein
MIGAILDALVYSLLFYFHFYLISITAIVCISMIIAVISANKWGN